MIQRIGRIALPPWINFVVAGAAVCVMSLIGIAWPKPFVPEISVAFIGNSMIYYNDLPRFMEELSDGHLSQNSCLHGNANFKSLLIMGNGMYNIWLSGSARIDEYRGSEGIRDYGSCTVAQLLFGYDEDLDLRVQQEASDDDAYEKTYGDDYYSYYDGSNPCLRHPEYYYYLQQLYEDNPPSYDYIVLNDNTRAPSRLATRNQSLQVLEDVYLPWFIESGATPVFLFTYAYWTPYRDMTGLGSVPEFTSLTFEGYKQYTALLEDNLPAAQRPRIAPVGLAFLIVWEENYSLWERLFHVDLIHCSPLGTFLQGCVLHHTLFGSMPKIDVAVRGDMFTLWMRARRFQPGDHRRTPFPTEEEAAYLYHVAKRVVVYGQMPQTLTEYQDGEAATYYPEDDLYKVDDLF